MGRILFVILATGDRVIFETQLINIRYYNPECIIYCNLSNELINYADYFKSKYNIYMPDKHTQLYIDKANPPMQGKFHYIWINAYRNMIDFEWSHMVLLSSNEMFIKSGLVRHLDGKDYALPSMENGRPINAYQDTNSFFWNNAIKNLAFKIIIKKFNLKYITHGQWEGTYYSRRIFKYINDKYGDILIKYDYGANAEEAILHTLSLDADSIFDDMVKTNCITSVVYDIGHRWTLDDVKNIQSDEMNTTIFSVKRIDRVIYDARLYLSNLDINTLLLIIDDKDINNNY